MSDSDSTTKTYHLTPAKGGSVATTKIQVTTDYRKFKYLIANRERNRGHIERLKDAFAEYGNLTEVQPIIVNEKMEIVDGQHRFQAAEELGLPIFFAQRAGLGINEARQMNILHKGWRSDDFAYSYANGGDASYKRYIELREEFPEFSHSTILGACKNAKEKGDFREFRDGDFTLTPDDYQKARTRLAEVHECCELVGTFQKELCYALLRSMTVTGYEHSRMVQKLKLQGASIPRYSAIPDYQRALEDAYNWKVSEEHRTRLY